MIQICIKEKIRKKILSKRLTLSSEEVIYLSNKINTKISRLEEFKASTRIGTYFSIKNEPIIERCANKKYASPKVLKDEIRFIKIQKNFKKGKFDIKEPYPSIYCDTNKLDILLIPLIAFNARLERIGFGRGYYDKLLSNICFQDKRPLFWGIGYEFQKVDEVFGTDLDIQLDRVITEKNIYE